MLELMLKEPYNIKQVQKTGKKFVSWRLSDAKFNFLLKVAIFIVALAYSIFFSDILHTKTVDKLCFEVARRHKKVHYMIEISFYLMKLSFFQNICRNVKNPIVALQAFDFIAYFKKTKMMHCLSFNVFRSIPTVISEQLSFEWCAGLWN